MKAPDYAYSLDRARDELVGAFRDTDRVASLLSPVLLACWANADGGRMVLVQIDDDWAELGEPAFRLEFYDDDGGLDRSAGDDGVDCIGLSGLVDAVREYLDDERSDR